MKVLSLVLIVLFVSVSFGWANQAVLKEAYSLYYKGDKEAEIKIMEDYVQKNPDPGVFYFLGYAYYEMKDMDKAKEYFSESFRLKSFYSPVSPEKSR